jgi:hypothetical protein
LPAACHFPFYYEAGKIIGRQARVAGVDRVAQTLDITRIGRVPLRHG